MDFSKPAECLELLQRLHPVDVKTTHATLSTMVGSLLEASPPPNQHLEVLEAAREVVAFTQNEMARRYAAHPLPPDSDENETLTRVVRLWNNIAQSYALIARRDAEQHTLDDQRALLAQRQVHFAGMELLEYFRAHRSVPAGCWAAVHAAYSAAVKAALHKVRVGDVLNDVWKAQSPLEAYISVLLVELANPYGRSERELSWIFRWAQRFAPYCTLSAELDQQKPTAYGVDFASDQGLRPLGLIARSPSLLRFDGSTLASQIQAVFAQFKRGVKPAALGLGEDCPVDGSARLLMSLYRPWGLASAGRRFPRRNASGELELTASWLGVGFAVDGKVFEQPRAEAAKPNLRHDISLFTFGERAAEAEDGPDARERHREAAEKLGLACEHWQLLDQSVGGFRVRRAVRGERLEHSQLVAIRPQDGEHFLLGQISWLMYHADGIMEAGVHVLAGLPRMVAARPTGSNGSRQPYQQAFMLPASPAMKQGASLVLPGFWFHSGRVIEIHAEGKTRSLRLDKLLIRGTNFDQCSYESEPSQG